MLQTDGTGPSHRPVLATYRIQLGPYLTFDDAAARVPYLADLGVSHLYLSPVLESVSGSPHGYDGTDPSHVREELGGRAGFERLAHTAHRHGLGLVVDIVPNHLGVARPHQNRWWWDVLRHGNRSAYADYFDIDWSADNGAGGKIALPVLTSPDDLTSLVLECSDGHPVLRLGATTFPVAPGTASTDPVAVHAAQSYRLIPWTSPIRTYRRFFTVDDLAAVRVEDPAVFAATHTEIASWFTDGLVDGLRIDHPDGLTDPVQYLRRLRELVGPRPWIVIEKILYPTEPLDPVLPVAGTTGYDALREIGHALLDPEGEQPLTALHRRWTGRDGTDDGRSAAADSLRVEFARSDLAPEFARLGRAAAAASPGTTSETRAMHAALAWIGRIPFYRDDYPVLATAAEAIRRSAIEDSTASTRRALRSVAAARAGGRGSGAALFAQLTGALTAKTVEDTLFYRSARLVSLAEVGGTVARFDGARFHASFGARARQWPATMTTLSTHDTKRGEDVRARIGILSQCPLQWSDAVDRWMHALPAAPDAMTGLFLLQNAFGIWPAAGTPSQELRQRLHDYATKALREARTVTSWRAPDSAAEDQAHRFIDGLFRAPVVDELTRFVADIDEHARSDALAQKLLQLAGPGVPDVYQGTEVWEDCLVDPDNRRPVPWSLIEAAHHRKKTLVRSTLRLRRERPRSFVGGSYVPVEAQGARSPHLLGFARGPVDTEPDVVVLATRWSLRLAAARGWGDTSVVLGAGRWTDILAPTSTPLSMGDAPGAVPLADVFVEHPVALLVRV